MSELEKLLTVFEELDKRSRGDARLERYRVAGSGRAGLDAIPAGWFLSDNAALLVSDGGWWPGQWYPGLDEQSSTFEDVLVNGLSSEAQATRRVRWSVLGDIWERDQFFTPLLRNKVGSAPVFGFSSQALWVSMVFPSEASILQAFIVTYDEMGMNENGEVDPFFVEWVTEAPELYGAPDNGRMRVHHRLVELAADWSTDHPCWRSVTMPVLATPESRLDAETYAAVLGVDSTQISL